MEYSYHYLLIAAATLLLVAAVGVFSNSATASNKLISHGGSPSKSSKSLLRRMTELKNVDYEVVNNQNSDKEGFVLPNVLLIGAQQSGTTSIANWMFNAGICASNIHQEPHFFDTDQRYNQGIEFYSRHYEHCLQNHEHVGNNQDIDGSKYIMDATSDTLWNTNRVHETYTQAGIEPHANLKIIVILREPTSRELSLYHSKVKQWMTLRDLILGDNTEDHDVQHHNFHDVVFINGTIMTFDQHVELILKDIYSDDTYLGRGTDSKYIDHLKQWTSYFDRSQILLLSHDEYIHKPQDVQLRIQGFLGVVLDGELKSNHGMIRKISKAANSILEPLFEKKNEELYEFLKEHDGPHMEQYPFPRFMEVITTVGEGRDDILMDWEEDA